MKYIVEQQELKEEFDNFADACKRARDLGNTGAPAKVLKNNKELYRTGRN